MKDALFRATRLFVFTFLGTIISSGALSVTDTGHVQRWAVIEKVLISALSAGISAVVSLTVNLLENTTAFPAFGKVKPSQVTTTDGQHYAVPANVSVPPTTPAA